MSKEVAIVGGGTALSELFFSNLVVAVAIGIGCLLFFYLYGVLFPVEKKKGSKKESKKKAKKSKKKKGGKDKKVTLTVAELETILAQMKNSEQK